MAKLSVMGVDGHLSFSWDPESEAEVEKAAKMFDDLKGKGYSFWVVKDGERGRQIKHFRDDAGQIMTEVLGEMKKAKETVAVPKVKGG